MCLVIFVTWWDSLSPDIYKDAKSLFNRHQVIAWFTWSLKAFALSQYPQHRVLRSTQNSCQDRHEPQRLRCLFFFTTG